MPASARKRVHSQTKRPGSVAMGRASLKQPVLAWGLVLTRNLILSLYGAEILRVRSELPLHQYTVYPTSELVTDSAQDANQLKTERLV